MHLVDFPKYEKFDDGSGSLYGFPPDGIIPWRWSRSPASSCHSCDFEAGIVFKQFVPSVEYEEVITELREKEKPGFYRGRRK